MTREANSFLVSTMSSLASLQRPSGVLTGMDLAPTTAARQTVETINTAWDIAMLIS